jgi:hypothetical protein
LEGVAAAAGDRPVGTPLPTFGLDDHASIADVICRHRGLRRRNTGASARPPQKLQQRDTRCTQWIVALPAAP